MNVSVRVNSLRLKLARRRAVVGPNLQIPSPELVEMIGLAGFDFVMLDGEHGAAYTRLPDLLTACDAAGLASVVRTPGRDRRDLLLPLELGAGALQVPFVNTVEEARQLVQEIKFPPLGRRGVSLVSRSARYGFTDAATFMRDANRETLLIVQIETVEAAEQAEAIAAVPGVDAVFLGPADLAQSLGEPPGRMTSRTARAVADLLRRLHPIKPALVSAFSAREVARWRRAGAAGFLTSSARPLGQALRSCCEDLRSRLR
jgi:4-hydroxy-2-oxoheptanedioate aldolase